MAETDETLRRAASTPFEPRHGEAVPVAPGVVRLTAPNPGPFTGPGTNSYLVGEGTLAVVDPGPADEGHLAALLRAIDGRPVSHILVTHTHADHSPLARVLAERTGAIVCAEGPHRAARPLREGEAHAMDASVDRAFAPDRALADGERVEGDGWAFETVLTPGHTANHAAFALEGGPLLSGDHVMAWSTTIVAPPDGAMRPYMRSLDRLIERREAGRDALYLPGHGGPVWRPGRFVKALRAHRLMREGAITERVLKGDRTIPAMVRAIYRTTDPRLHGAAALSVLAHLEELVARGVVDCGGVPTLHGTYLPS